MRTVISDVTHRQSIDILHKEAYSYNDMMRVRKFLCLVESVKVIKLLMQDAIQVFTLANLDATRHRIMFANVIIYFNANINDCRGHEFEWIWLPAAPHIRPDLYLITNRYDSKTIISHD